MNHDQLPQSFKMVPIQRDILSQHSQCAIWGKIETSRDERFGEVERCRKRLESTVLILYLRFKKIRSKNIFSSWRKMILEKNRWKVGNIHVFPLNSKLIVSLLREKWIFPTFHRTFFQIIFLQDDNIFFDRICLNLK